MESKATLGQPGSTASAQGTAYAILAAISVSHMLNDTIQSLIPAIYPMLKQNFSLDFGQIGLITGLFFGLAFGLGGLGAAALGELADVTSIETVYHVCSFLPAVGLLAVFLPDIERRSLRLEPAR